ncbi:peroxisomal leader peptide-processing protease [Diachasma alloeum]|uniref:peroxisomal leader peptide-processing protease n=1 Tax=Diachasma alloeum TaxID=454923 RepID=UPI000738365E|nr:peroxisomal leader peptide-processing protease [Diachasma alloeum]XP_015109447.1 peroxisomal leader peptide-processing protease [Diachasma alloeum]XP_015109449.1 peroxisomal leader peptide-processing protease [Diachasma alloeum]XP_015109450.1 peroxisomal leader peptide-processing protease [Diachasma alloeum]XP_015109451.1 peroxisomal leader peptide-processing protease [Diachasma alloeum]
MESTSVSISFVERSSSEVSGASGIKISDTWVLTSGLFYATSSNKNNDTLHFIRGLKPGILTCIPIPQKNSHVRVSVTSRTGPRTLRTNEASVEDSKISETCGTICGAWRCPLLSDTLENLFHGWSFDEDSKKTDKDLLTIFLLVRLHDGEAEFTVTETLRSAEQSLSHLLRVCEPLETPARGVHMLIESTPFGNPVFIDSVSRGIVSNVLGAHDCVILTDANAVPGCEGGPVYVRRPNGSRLLCGMVIAPLSWCRGEWVDYTLVARLVPCLMKLLRKHENIENCVTGYGNTSLTELLDKSVVLVRCGAEWGSGIVLDRDTGTILTCSHVVKEAPERRIRVVLRTNNNRESSSSISGVWATLVYRTPRGQAYDVAVLSVDTQAMDPTLRALEIADGAAEKGETVVSAGFPFFSSTLPTITRGNISRVSTCMLQTTCCVQSGASGGPIVRSTTGELLGMVVCNIITSRTLYPRLNMAVPMAAIKESITDYIKTGCVDVLSALTKQDAAVRDAWNFHLPSKI